MEEEKKLIEEIKKCKESPYYFYTNYFTVNGQRPTTRLTETQFNNIFNAVQATEPHIRKTYKNK